MVHVVAFFGVRNVCGAVFGQADPGGQGLSVETSVSRFLESSSSERFFLGGW